MRGKGVSRKAGGRVRVGRRMIGLPSVPTTEVEATPPTGGAEAAAAHPQPPIERGAVQYLDRVRAVFRPKNGRTLAPGVERFIGTEDIFRHVGEGDMPGHGSGPMMQCPVHWSNDLIRVPIDDLEILEILEDQDVRAG